MNVNSGIFEIWKLNLEDRILKICLKIGIFKINKWINGIIIIITKIIIK